MNLKQGIRKMTADLYRVIHPVSDIGIATEFFSAVLGAAGERVSPGRHYFECGATVLACYDPVADGDDHRKNRNA